MEYGEIVHQRVAESMSVEWEGGAASEGLREVVERRQREKTAKQCKFVSFERDLRIMYLKSVFNCLNEMIIEVKSFYTFMNGRSSIGPGELTLAIRDFNSKATP